MIKNKKAMITGLVTLLLAVLFVQFSYAQEMSSAPIENIDQQVGLELNEQDVALEKKIVEIQQSLISQKERADTEVKRLELLVDDQRRVIQDLEVQIKALVDKPLTNGTTFEVWSAILLGASALIITTLGVGIAILTFVGYDQLVNKGAKKAENKAVQEAKKTIPLLISDAIKGELDQLVSEGYLNSVVEEAMQEIAYRNISFVDETS